jgi:hypothetical protein
VNIALVSCPSTADLQPMRFPCPALIYLSLYYLLNLAYLIFFYTESRCGLLVPAMIY